jgi:uncharacterized membrane protein YbhN (UPF0104 family)
MMTRTRIRYLKIALTVVLLAVLISNARWADSRVYIDQVSGVMSALSLALLGLGLAVSTLKWSYALRLQSLKYPFWHLFRALCGGFFLNNFLPTSVGGDAYRVYRTLPQDTRSRAVGAVVVERVVGLVALLILGSIGAILVEPRATITVIYIKALLVGAIAFAFICAAFGFAYRCGWLAMPFNTSRMVRIVVDRVMHLRRDPNAWLMLAALSFAFQTISISVIYLLFQDVAAPVSWLQCALITAIVGVAALLPISLNGLGLAEGALVGAALSLGLNYDQALVVAIVRRVLAMCLSVLCGIFYLTAQHPIAVQMRGERAPAGD